MDVFINGDIYDGAGAVRTGLRIRCTPNGGSFYPPDTAPFAIGKVYHLIAEDRSLAIRLTQFVVEFSRPRTEVRFVALGPADSHPADARTETPDGRGDTKLLLSTDPDTDVLPALPPKP